MYLQPLVVLGVLMIRISRKEFLSFIAFAVAYGFNRSWNCHDDVKMFFWSDCFIICGEKRKN